SDREAGSKKQQRAEDALPDRGEIDRAMTREPQDDRQQDPADRVVDYGRRYDQLADRAPQKIELADRQRDDLDRGDRQRRPDKQRRDEALVGMRQHAVRQGLAQRDPAQERHRDTGQRDAERGFAGAPHQRQIGFHAGQEQQHQDAELRDRIDHRLLLGERGEQGMLGGWPQYAQNTRPQDDTRQQLAHNCRLPD